MLQVKRSEQHAHRSQLLIQTSQWYYSFILMSPPHPDTSSWRPPGPRTLLWEPQRKHLLVTTNTCLPGFCIPASWEAAFFAPRGLRPSLLTCSERISMKKGDKCCDLWTESKATWDLIHMESPVGRKWEGRQHTPKCWWSHSPSLPRKETRCLQCEEN